MTQGSAGLPISRLTLLQPHGEGKPLFIFPDVYGEPETFRDMANQLGEQRPIYGFQHIGAQLECEPVRQVSRLAQLYAAELRRAEPHGPYYLLGYAFGAIVAFETARELDSQGQAVGLVILVDCAVPGYRLGPVWQRARWRMRDMVDATTQLAAPRHMRSIRAALEEAHRYYRPSPQAVDVLFLTAETDRPGRPANSVVDPLLGWAPALRGRISHCGDGDVRADSLAKEHCARTVARVQRALMHSERRRESGQSTIKPIAM